MTSWKRLLIDAVTRPLGIQLVRTDWAWQLLEPEQLRRFLARFRIDCVFDVGANNGQYAVRLRRLGFKGCIVSFEPIPAAAARVRHLARRDHRWIVQELALDSQSRTATFNVMQDAQFSSLHDPDHSATGAFRVRNSVQQRLEVHTRTIAELFPELKAQLGFERPFLKLDTQGHDVAVVEGAGPYMQEFLGLQSELAITPLYRGARGYREALEFYHSLGFKLSALVPNNAGAFPDLNEIDCIMYNTRFVPTPAAAATP